MNAWVSAAGVTTRRRPLVKGRPRQSKKPVRPDVYGVRMIEPERRAGAAHVVDAAVLVEGLVKTFGATRALDGLDLVVPRGSVLGLLGPNGAGKTTAVRVLSTLLKADSGRAEVAGVDVARDPQRVRQMIGLTGQFAAVDEYLTGRENLRMFGRLFHLSRADAARRADDLLERFDLADAASRLAKTYSGGMRRRLDIASSLIAAPLVLFLDEPTTGLDPRSRLGMWDVIRDLVRDGTTILLTTQYLEEADALADSIAVIDAGRVIARGTAAELKDRVGGTRLEVVVGDRSGLDAARVVLGEFGDDPVNVDEDELRVSVPVRSGTSVLAEVVRRLDASAVEIADLALRRPTLDDVFLQLTGHAAAEAGVADAAAPAGGRSAR
jgi:ABC-2 type transport system ATP-binding protein